MQDTTIAVDLAKSVFEVAVSQRPGTVRERRRLSRTQFARLLERTGARDTGDGGLRHRPLLGSRSPGVRASGRAAAAARGAPLRVAQQDRWGRREGVAGSGSQRGHPARPGQVRRSARARSAPPLALDLDGHAHGTVEHLARAFARARIRDPGRGAPGRAFRPRTRLRRRVGPAGGASIGIRGGRARDRRAREADPRGRASARRTRKRKRSRRAAAHDPGRGTAHRDCPRGLRRATFIASRRAATWRATSGSPRENRRAGCNAISAASANAAIRTCGCS